MVLVIMVMTEGDDGDYGSGKSDNHGEGGTSHGDMMRWSQKWWRKRWECGEHTLEVTMVAGMVMMTMS